MYVNGLPLRRLWLSVLFGYLALGATIQALPEVAEADYGAGPGTVGALVTMAAGATALVRPIAGRFADRHDPRGAALAGAILVAGGALGHLLAPGLAGLAVARLALGAGEGALFTGALAWVLRGAPAERRGQLVGHFGLSMWGGLAAGPPLAAALMSVAGGRAALELAVLAGASSLLLCLWTPRGVGPTGTVSTGRLLPPRALRLGAILALSSFGYGTLNAFVLLHVGAERLGGAGLALGTFAAAFLVVRLAGSRLVDDVGPRTVALASVAVEAVALVGVALAPTAPLLLAALVALGAGVALVFPSLAVWLVEETPEHERGAAVGAMTSCWDVGIAVAGPVGGLVVSSGHFGAAFVLAAGASASAALALGIQRARRPASLSA